MSLNPLKLLKDGLSSVVGLIPGVGPIAKQLIDGIDTEVAKLPPAEQAALELKVREMKMEEMRLLIADNADFRKQVAVEIQSDDPFVRRARPANLWLWIVAFVFWLVIFPLLRSFGLDVNVPDLTGIPTQAWYTYAVLFLGYSAAREIGKFNKLRHGRSAE